MYGSNVGFENFKHIEVGLLYPTLLYHTSLICTFICLKEWLEKVSFKANLDYLMRDLVAGGLGSVQ